MIEELGTSAQPSRLSLPDKAEYWATCGSFSKSKGRAPKQRDAGDFWLRAYYTQEDAEAAAVAEHTSGWTWNGEPARVATLSELMFTARRKGFKGVGVYSFTNGQWTAVKTYPANEPLPIELRDTETP